jgi:hypothetical protein
VIVQLLEAARVAPHVVEEVVPDGKVGKLTLRFCAVLDPTLVIVITLGNPELGVPLTPDSVIPVTLKASRLRLAERVVELSTQVTLTLVMFEKPAVPEPLVTIQVCVAG